MSAVSSFSRGHTLQQMVLTASVGERYYERACVRLWLKLRVYMSVRESKRVYKNENEYVTGMQ